MRDTDPAKVKPLFYELARKWDGKDRYYLCALGICAGTDKNRRDALLADFDKQIGPWDSKTGGLLWELRPPMALTMMEKRLAEPTLTAREQQQIVETVANVDDPAAGKVLLAHFASLPEPAKAEVAVQLKANLGNKWLSLRKSKELQGTVKSLLDAPATRIVGVELASAADDQDLIPALKDYAVSATESPAVRLAAAKALLHFKQDAEATATFIQLAGQDMNGPANLANDSVLALGGINSPKATDFLHDAAKDSKKYPLPLRQAAVASLAGTSTGTVWLMEAYSKKQLAADLTADLSRLLYNTPFKDSRKKATALFPPPPPLDPKSLPSIQALVAKKGSIERGQKLIAASLKSEVQCLKCHTINGVGGQVGPDLSTIGSKASRENLLESILYPSRAIADQYQQYAVETKNGIVINAIVTEESPRYLVLRDVNAKEYKVNLGDIDSKKKVPTSLMPELIRYLSEQDLVDIVDYLYSLKNAPIGAVYAPRDLESGRYFASRSRLPGGTWDLIDQVFVRE
jgi:putative heme-binding domain-containing protein